MYKQEQENKINTWPLDIKPLPEYVVIKLIILLKSTLTQYEILDLLNLNHSSPTLKPRPSFFAPIKTLIVMK